MMLKQMHIAQSLNQRRAMIENLSKIGEITENQISEARTDREKFDPDKRIAKDEIKESSESNREDYDPDARIHEIKPHSDGFYTTREDRIRRTNPDKSEGGQRGEWNGERGDSLFQPAYQFMKEKLSAYGLDGIQYKNGEADFSKVSLETVKIDNMTSERYGYGNNFYQANYKLAERWNQEGKLGRNDWKTSDVEQYRKDNNLTWHERCDMETMDLVPRDVHEYFKHSGGCAECKIRDGIGGGFDA